MVVVIKYQLIKLFITSAIYINKIMQLGVSSVHLALELNRIELIFYG